MSELETRLERLAALIDWPEPSPNSLPTIRAGFASRSRRRTLRPAAALAAVLAVVLVFSPAARHAVAGILVAAGVRIDFVSAQTEVGSGLIVGEVVDLAGAKQRVSFPVLVPQRLGEPDTIYLDGAGRLTMVWAEAVALPAAPGSDIGVLLTQSRAIGEGYTAVKQVSGEVELVIADVGGATAIWVEGAPHLFTLVDETGAPIAETTRLAANVLLWERDGVAYRLETSRGLDFALAVAESLSAG